MGNERSTMFRVGLVTLQGVKEAKDFETRDEVDTYILEIDEKETVTRFRIEVAGKVIETETGRRE